MCHEWDTGTGIQYSSTIGESNNDTQAYELKDGFKPDKIVNQGHLERCAKTNIDITDTTRSSLASLFGTSTGLLNTENQYYPISGWKLTESDLCNEGFRLRPHVVWFGESVPNFDQAIELIEKADYFVVIGTSLQVYPAANLVHFCKSESQKYIIDPHVDSFQIPSDFIRIPANAISGVEELYNLLMNSL
jgi:NAD-dependent deacetylase